VLRHSEVPLTLRGWQTHRNFSHAALESGARRSRVMEIPSGRRKE
jgi:hypothetical protein